MFCNNCPSKTYQNSKLMSSGDPLSKYVIISDSINKDEMSTNKMLTGGFWPILWNVLNSFGFVRKDFYLTSVVKCLVRDPTDFTVKHCAQHLKGEMEQCTNKRLIIVIGSKAYNSMVLNDARSITQASGRLFSQTSMGCPILACIHPALTTYSESNKILFKQSLSSLMAYRAVIENFGSLNVITDEDSEKFATYKKLLKDTYMLKMIEERREPKFKY